MKKSVTVMDSSGDIKIIWDTNNEQQMEEARKAVLALKETGYSFFLVDGRVADEVSAGDGSLNCRKINAEEILETPPEATESASEVPVRPTVRAKKRTDTPESEVIAVRPLRGG